MYIFSSIIENIKEKEIDIIMKKIPKVLTTLLLLSSSLAFLPFKAEAATSSWFGIADIPGCQVRIWTDANTYYSGAKTVDTYAETNGKCGTLYYSAFIADAYGTISKETFDGSFALKSPTKSFNIDNFISRNRNPVSANVTFLLYKNSGHTRLLTGVEKIITYYQ